MIHPARGVTGSALGLLVAMYAIDLAGGALLPERRDTATEVTGINP